MALNRGKVGRFFKVTCRHVGFLRRIMDVKLIIKPRRNIRADRGPPERRRTVILIGKLGDEGWARMVG